MIDLRLLDVCMQRVNLARESHDLEAQAFALSEVLDAMERVPDVADLTLLIMLRIVLSDLSMQPPCIWPAQQALDRADALLLKLRGRPH